MALTGTKMAMISTALPVMLVAIGVADAIHILTDYYHRLRAGEQVQTAIRTVLRHIGTAIVLTSVTTSVGFLSLTTSPVRQVKEFGLFVGFGVMVALVVSVTLIPAVLKLLGPLKGVTKAETGDSAVGDEQSALISRLSKYLGDLGRWVTDNPIKIFVVTILLFGLAVVGMTRIRVETKNLRIFPPNSEVLKSTDLIDQYFGGSESLSIIVDSDIKEPEVLNQILELQEEMEELPKVGHTVSIADYVAEINKALHDNDPSQRKIPDTRNAVAQEILLYEMSGDPSDFEQVVNYNYDRARIMVRLSHTSSAELRGIISKVEDLAQSIGGDTLKVQITGSAYLFMVLSDLLMQGQITSLLIALLAVALIIGLIFRSFYLGLLSAVPLGLTLSINFGLMGWAGIALDTATTLVASIAIGIGIDYTIHLVSRFRLERKKGNSPRLALIKATKTTGEAITYNAIAVAVGFGVLLTSTFTPVATLGALVALTMVISASAALTILSASLFMLTRTRDGEVVEESQT